MAAPLRVLVTGADGFVGRHACRYFRERGEEVIELDGPKDGGGGVDIVDLDAVRLAIESARPDRVLHLAGFSSVVKSHEHPGIPFRVNALGTLNLLEAVRRSAPNARLLHVSSGEVYGAIPCGSRAKETDAPAPTSPYGASKIAAEVALSQYHRAYGVQALVARPFNHLGPGQSPSFFLPSFASQLARIRAGTTPAVLKVGNLESVRDFLHVQDVVAAYALLLETGTPGETYNISSGEPRSIRQVLDELIRFSGTKVDVQIDPARLRPADVPWLVGDSGKMQCLGWRPTQGLSRIVSDVWEEVSLR